MRGLLLEVLSVSIFQEVNRHQRKTVSYGGGYLPTQLNLLGPSRPSFAAWSSRDLPGRAGLLASSLGEEEEVVVVVVGQLLRIQWWPLYLLIKRDKMK